MDLSEFSPGLLRQAATKEPETLRVLPKLMGLMLELKRGLQAVAKAGQARQEQSLRTCELCFNTDKRFKQRFD